MATTERLARRMHNGYFKKPKEDNICKEPHLTKRQKWHKFDLEDKVNMLHEVIVGKEKQTEVAKKYHRTVGYVSNLIRAMKKNNELLRELI